MIKYYYVKLTFRFFAVTGNMILILLLVLGLTLLYLKLVKAYSYWTDRGVKQRKQTYLFGDNAGILLRKESVVDFALNLYNAFPGERYMGVYQMTTPALLIRDPELIKRITVKDFDHFVDHRFFVPDGIDPLWSRNLISLKGEKWHEMRSTLSPTFTASKMKIIFSLISECAEEYVEYLEKLEEETISLELKDAFTRFANDVIATSAFGIKCNSMKEKENEFYIMGKDLTNFSGVFKIIKVFLFGAPRICKLFGIKFFSKKVRNFFTDIIVETIRTREEHKITRPDMLHLLMEARKHKHEDEKQKHEDEKQPNDITETHSRRNATGQEISDLDITAHALAFFFAGFESVSTAMCFMGHELATHEEIQKKLQIEVDETLKECNGRLTYEALMKMRYMDMVVSESLRMWPPAVVLDRLCVKPYVIEAVNGNEKLLRLETNDTVWIPAIGLHRDPKYFPNPEVFDPERFSEENKSNIQPYTYLPFGVGPRNCIGSRFALMEIKALFFYLISKFDFVRIEKTQVPLKLKIAVTIQPENGFWVGLKRRSHTI